MADPRITRSIEVVVAAGGAAPRTTRVVLIVIADAGPPKANPPFWGSAA